MKRRNKLEISLFSFQDIITSVTGIIILITLLMALDLIQAAAKSPAVATQQMISLARAQLQSLKDRVRDMRTDFEGQIDEIVAAQNLRPESVEAQNAALENEKVELRSRQNAIERQRLTLANARDRLENGPETAESLALETEKIEQAIKKAKEQESLALEGVLVLVEPRAGDTRERWLVEITDKGIRFATPENPKAIRTLDDPAALRKWIHSKDPDRHYFYLLFGPEKFEWFDEIVEFCRSGPNGRSYGYGIDLLLRGQSVFDRLRETNE